MGEQISLANKNPQTDWHQYEAYANEPREKERYDIKPEEEEELLGYGLFLKQRVFKNMHKIKRQNTAKRHDDEEKTYKVNHLRGGRLAHS